MTAVLRGRKHGRYSNLTKTASTSTVNLCEPLFHNNVLCCKNSFMLSHAHIATYEMKCASVSKQRFHFALFRNKQVYHMEISI